MPKQVLLPTGIREQLLVNGRRSAAGDKIDPTPVVKLFAGSSATWLLTELDPSDPDIAFGLCDPGLGTPELGPVSISEIKSLDGMRPPGSSIPIFVERDEHIRFDRPLSAYARAARAAGRIVTKL